MEKTAKQAFDLMVAKENSGGGAVAEILMQLSDLKIQRARLPGNKLGMEKARSIYEAIMGDLDETVEYVDHSETPAPIDLPPSESIEAAPVGVQIGDGAGNDATSTVEPDFLPIVILRYSQTKQWFKEALLEGDEMLTERSGAQRP